MQLSPTVLCKGTFGIFSQPCMWTGQSLICSCFLHWPILEWVSVALPTVASSSPAIQCLCREYGCIHPLSIDGPMEVEGSTQLAVLQISAGCEAWRGCCLSGWGWLEGRSSRPPTDYSLCPAVRRNTLRRITKLKGALVNKYIRVRCAPSSSTFSDNVIIFYLLLFFCFSRVNWELLALVESLVWLWVVFSFLLVLLLDIFLFYADCFHFVLSPL